jgi:pSer/pThr/pTyr-binding forkhead associated (FHA) protein
MISSRHCCMTPISGELRVEDMGSTNGIRINGYRVFGGRLRPGDELSIADIRYRLIDDQGAETTFDDPVELDHGCREGHKTSLHLLLRPPESPSSNPPPAGREPLPSRLDAVAPVCPSR